ncbi:MAG TPA: hypothetical protein VGG05_24645 [Pseudonocardiaceae bacterium]|jgi:hypothetical protein
MLYPSPPAVTSPCRCWSTNSDVPTFLFDTVGDQFDAIYCGVG